MKGRDNVMKDQTKSKFRIHIKPAKWWSDPGGLNIFLWSKISQIFFISVWVSCLYTAQQTRIGAKKSAWCVLSIPCLSTQKKPLLTTTAWFYKQKKMPGSGVQASIASATEPPSFLSLLVNAVNLKRFNYLRLAHEVNRASQWKYLSWFSAAEDGQGRQRRNKRQQRTDE